MQVKILHDVETGRFFAFEIIPGEVLLAGYLGCFPKKPLKKQLLKAIAVKNKKKGDKTNEPIFKVGENGQLCIT